MNNHTKSSRIDYLIREAVAEQLYEAAYNDDALRGALKHNNMFECIKIGAAFNVSGNRGRMRELQDIMDWKFPRTTE